MGDEEKEPTNFRERRKQDERALLWLAAGSLIVVGGIMIWLVYGAGALLTGVPCLVGGALLMGGPWLLLQALQKWRDSLDD